MYCCKEMGDLDLNTLDHHHHGETKKEVAVNKDSNLEFSEDEVMLVERMFSLLGPRWTLIAGRIPGRTAEEIEKYWNSKKTLATENKHLDSKCQQSTNNK